jgi:cytochrome c
MKRFICGIMLLIIALFFGTVYAATLDEAKTLGERAASYVKANGKEKGIAEIGNPKGQFVKGEMYVTLHDFKGVFLANPVAPAMAGQMLYDLKDPNGKLFVREQIETAKTKGGGWVEYVWTNPVSKKVQPKKSWVQRIDGTEMYTLSGLFQ